MILKNIVQIVAILIVLSIFPFSGLQAEPIVLGKAITWVHAGDKWELSQMALVRAEFDEEISYGSKEYIGPQTAQALMSTFDKPYDRKHARTVVTVFSKASIAEIKRNEMMGIHAWSELLSKEGVPISFKDREIDARYPRTRWLQLLLERGVTIESLIDYFLCMAHRHQLAFLEDSPHLWKPETEGTSAIDAWQTYKADYIKRFVRYYTRNWKTAAEAAGKRLEASKSRIPKVPNVPAIPQIPQFHSEPEETALSPLQRLVNQLEQTVEDLERQNRSDAAGQVKEALEYIKKILERDKTPNEPNRNMKRTSRYPPL
ncbi:MAG: hypothetical protein OXL96_19370 [Candidatus Poribacteria bacterium]|nr:hypothetical protein [Candidatus Poribacteria bacterium]